MQLYFLYTKLVYLMSAKLEQLSLYLMRFNCAEVQLKIWRIFDCAKVEILQVYFRYTLNILHLKTYKLFKDHTVLIISDTKTHFRLNINNCASCASSTPKKV